MKYKLLELLRKEEGVSLVEYGLLVGVLGFAMFQIWSYIRMSLTMSYWKILKTIRKMTYP